MPLNQEPKTLDLAALTEKSDYIVKIKNALENAVGQKVVIVTVLGVTRTGGVYCRPVDFSFLGGQTLTLFIRAGADAFKAKLNGKELVLSGDFSDYKKDTFDRAVKYTADAIRNNQKKFEKAQQKVKLNDPNVKKTPSSTKATVPQQLKDLAEQETKLTDEIAKKQKTISELEEQLASL